MGKHVCPVWVGYLLANPLRRLYQNPEKILAPYVRPDMAALDIGCAMGFFSLPLARMVGPSGKVVCVDMQEKMLKRLERRARKAGLAERIQARLCSQDSLRLDDPAGAIDFALAFAVVHEVPDASRLFSEIHGVLKPGAVLLVAEPRGRISPPDFNESISVAERNGFVATASPPIRRSFAVALSKK